MNKILTKFPYCRNGIWKFDDASVNIKGEPFVGEVNNMIDLMICTSIPEAKDTEKGITAHFSRDPFPGYEHVFYRKGTELGGTWYRFGGFDGWLCPALFKYFETAPPFIYIKIEARKQKTGFIQWFLSLFR